MPRTFAIASGEWWVAKGSPRKVDVTFSVLENGSFRVDLPKPAMSDFVEYLLRSLNHSLKECGGCGFGDEVFDEFAARFAGDKHVPLFPELAKH